MFQIGHDNFHLDFNIRKNGICFSNISHKFCSYTTSAENQSADIKLSLPTGKKITLYWGDGTSTVVTGEVTTTTYSHIYTDIGTYNLTVTGDYNDITYLLFDGDGSYSGDIKYLPDNLTYVYREGDNTFSGDIIDLSNVTYFRITGQNTITGSIINFNRNMYYLKLFGPNTLYGQLKDLPPALQYLILSGNLVLNGDVASIPDQVVYFYLYGHNTVSDYTGKTWTTNMSVFKLVPVSPGGLSSAEIDQLIIDLDEDLDWSGGGIIYLTGTNAPRTSASDDAVSNIEAEGGTIFTN